MVFMKWYLNKENRRGFNESATNEYSPGMANAFASNAIIAGSFALLGMCAGLYWGGNVKQSNYSNYDKFAGANTSRDVRHNIRREYSDDMHDHRINRKRQYPPRSYPGAVRDYDFGEIHHKPFNNYAAMSPTPAYSDNYSLDASPIPAEYVCYDTNPLYGYVDADEHTAYHARFRGEPTRVINGAADRINMIDRYVRDDLNLAENAYWWGRHEY